MADPESPLRALFCAALECPTAEEQSAFLDQACQGNAELRARLEELLRAHREAGSFIQPSSVESGETIDEIRPGVSPCTITTGRYKLLQTLGEGGMGTVYLAEQHEPVKRRVAARSD